METGPHQVMAVTLTLGGRLYPTYTDVQVLKAKARLIKDLGCGISGSFSSHSLALKMSLKSYQMASFLFKKEV